MPTITLTITVDVPDGTTVEVTSDGAGADTDPSGLPREVADAIEQFVPSKYRSMTRTYLERCSAELGCTVVMPDSERRFEYVNLYPPPRCRRSRVAAVTYSSSRTAVFTGAIDLSTFQLAEETMNGGTYAYPKLRHLDSPQAVEEAIELAKMAIERLER